MKKTIMVLTVLLIVVVGLIGTGAIALAAPPDAGTISTSEGDYYTFVTPDTLFYNGHNANSFQAVAGSEVLGPGPGFRGGRWFVDANGNGQYDEGEAVAVHCPLAGPVK